MVRRPIAVCFFDDGKDYGDFNKMKEKDILTHLKESPLNLDIAKHILDVTVSRDTNGYAVGSIALDNEASQYTTQIFNRIFASYISLSEDKANEKTFLAEGVNVVIYMGYYTGIGKWDEIVKKMRGVVSEVNFSFQQNGTPQMVLSIEDSYTFMGNPRMRNTELTLQPIEKPGDFTPLQNAYPYTSKANLSEVRLLTGAAWETGGAAETASPNSPNLSADGNFAIGGGGTYDGDTATMNGIGKQTPSKKKKKYKLHFAQHLKARSLFAENPGLRDSQAVLLIVDRYNKMIDLAFPVKSLAPKFNLTLNQASQPALKNTSLYTDKAQIDPVLDENERNRRMREELRIKKTFVIMTGEGGTRYSTMSVFDSHVRENKVAQPVSMGFSDLLLSLAAKHHFDVFVKNQCLFFMPPVLKKQADVTYYYGSTKEKVENRLLSFTPKLTSVQLGVDYHAFEFNPDNGLVDFIRAKFGRDLENAVVYVVGVSPSEGGEQKYFSVNGETTAPKATEELKAMTELTGSEYVTMSYFSSGTEEVIKSITETEADVIAADMELEGNPFLDIGMTVGVRGLDGDKPIHKRFDANYRITAITDSYSGVYKTTLKTITRSLQGVSAASDEGNYKQIYIGIYSSQLLLEPSIVWAGQDTPEGKKVVASLRGYLSGLATEKGTNITNPSLEVDCLINNENAITRDGITGVHTIAADKEAGLTFGDDGMFQEIAKGIPCLTYNEAFEIMGYPRLPFDEIILETKQAEL